LRSSTRVADRMDQRVHELCAGFAERIARFADSDIFSSPSWYFHRKTLALRAQHASLRTLLDDDRYFDALCATLTAWSLHRMGPGNTKLPEISAIRDSVRENAEPLGRLTPLNIATVREEVRDGLPTARPSQVIPMLGAHRVGPEPQ
jgi:hypothetical protein